MTAVTIYHNPKCGTSRHTLAWVRNAGVGPIVVLYVEAPPARAELETLIREMKISVRDVLRRKGTPYDELNLDDAAWTDAQLLDLMLAHPILINRPIVVTPWGTRLCRPSEAVLEILPLPQLNEFMKEDGERVIDAQGQRVV